ncbi:MAG: response regulator [Hyphomonadaceae bacterium]|nr:response regulator [Hyphomonadaceae bacterium]
MKFFQRSMIALGVAAILPTLAFASILGVMSLRGAQNELRATASRQVQMVNALAAAELEADMRVVHTVSASPVLLAGAWREYGAHALRLLEANPSWNAIVASDAATGALLFGVDRAGGAVTAVPPALAPPVSPSAITVSGVGVDERGVASIAIHAPAPADGPPRYTLTILKSPASFQALLEAWSPKVAVAALVDREGRFIARSLAPESRVGQSASESLRAALQSGPGGVYNSVTLEGAQTFTTFETVPRTGWSTHVAYPRDRIDLPRGASLAVAVLGGLGALGLAGLLVALVLRDMADRRRAEDALRHAQKMEAVGQLTGGIAHDFNNLLTPIIGGLERIRARLGADERTHRILDNALEAARRAAKLTSQLLAFSRSQKMQIAPIDMAGLLDGVRDLLLHSVGQNVRVEIVAPPGLSALSDASQLELALINLAVNARDAMPRGGTLTITVKAIDWRGSTQAPAGRYVDIAVADTGVGMSEDVRARAMEPFFTTKPTGAGTGLGLAQVFAVARQSGGDVEIISAPGRGTTIHVRLPRADVDAPAAPLIAHPGNDDPPPGPRARVLVVDDDAFVRAHIVDTLEAAGFAVIDAPDATAALALLDAQRFDVLVADFAMPGMNGAELIRAARNRHPTLRALIVSGYSDSAAIAAAAGDVRVLRKPFDVDALVDAVNETAAR